MFATLRKKLRWGQVTPRENLHNQRSLLLVIFIGLLEEVLFWKTMWLSLTFILSWQIIFLICVYRQVSLLQFMLCLTITVLCMDAFETWLKYKHRTSCLKRMANVDVTQLNITISKFCNWIQRRWHDFIFIRETNHTKAFLLVNIILGSIFFFGKYFNGYLLIYTSCMFLCVSYKVVPPVKKILSHIVQDIESETEFEGLIPEASDVDIKLLSIEPEKSQYVDDRQSLDYWKPDDVPIEEASDSSETSSLVTNFSMEKVKSLQKDVETSDSSEDEYIPLDRHKEPLISTLEVAEPASSWSSSAYNALWNIKDAVSNIMYSDTDIKRERVSSVDSSDGFEIIDKNDLN